MVERQLRRRGIEDERVLAAMGAVPRERFVPPRERRRAYRDGALPIGSGQTISQPWIVAAMAQALELEGDERVLEVGTGSGYSAAVLSLLCRERRHDRAPRRARRPGAGAPARARLHERRGARRRRHPRRARPRAVRRDLGDRHRRGRSRRRRCSTSSRPHGTLVCPVRRCGGEHLVRVRDGEEEVLAAVRFVPLVSDE